MNILHKRYSMRRALATQRNRSLWSRLRNAHRVYCNNRAVTRGSGLDWMVFSLNYGFL